MTLVELMVVVVILSVIAIPMTVFLTKTLKNVTLSAGKIKAQENIRRFLTYAEPYIWEANEIIAADSDSVTFIVDSNRMPGYDPYDDRDGDGVPDIMDPDIDGDAMLRLMTPPTAQWTHGYNLQDDDDDGDGKIDARIRLYRDGSRLRMEASWNEAPWTQLAVLDGVTAFSIEYFGSKTQDLGRNIDLDDDGTITAYEMDWALPTQGHGNRSGSLDTAVEFRYIVSIYMEIGADGAADGLEDFRIRAEYTPPLLVLKRNL
jgi:hypothetical protein